MSKALSVALVGADTPAAQTVLDVLGEMLADMSFAIAALYPLSDDEDAGTVELRDHVLPVIDVEVFDWSTVEAAVFVGVPELASKYAAQAAQANVAVIDLTGATQSKVGQPRRGQIVSLPHVLTSMVSATLAAFKTLGQLDFAAATAMVSVSEDGKSAIEALSMQTRQLFAQQEVELAGYPKRLAFNVLPTAQRGEEARIHTELAAAGHAINSLTVSRVPVFFGHAVSVTAHFAAPQTMAALEEAIHGAPALYLLQGSGAVGIATPQDAIGGDKVWANQLQLSEDGRTATIWLVADNARLPARAAALLLALV
ncbi:Asd/ArgC dimerization domain-containing protein [Chitinibacter sp. GC72]|uniref:Asd/ArgC dimerization domain-containing protein n=1 Tax=Chitinibacter sp. GC72 TaxID=1526917 RepID=UPI0012F7E26B|nr:Asd/ArgC dimerization domain-containing protein [Chitinibacter sp. GC72]